MSTTAYEIPLLSAPQSLSISLAGVAYNLVVRWNDPAQAWVLDISDANNNLLIGGIAMTTGVDLLGQYQYLGFGGSLYVQSDFDTLAEPTYYNLGSTAHLYFVVTTE
jgi:hypothetical protein